MPVHLTTTSLVITLSTNNKNNNNCGPFCRLQMLIRSTPKQPILKAFLGPLHPLTWGHVMAGTTNITFYYTSCLKPNSWNPLIKWIKFNLKKILINSERDWERETERDRGRERSLSSLLST